MELRISMKTKQGNQKEDKKILLVVDVQYGFERKESTKKNAEKIANLLRKDIFDAVIATQFFNRKNSVYDCWLHWPRLMEPADIMLDTEVQKKSRFVIRKDIYHCPEEELMTDLRACNGGNVPGSVFICGMDTDCCVQLIAAKLFESAIHPIVLTSYCASNGGEQAHQAGLTVMSRVLGRMHLIEAEPDCVQQLDEIREALRKIESEK